MSGATCDTLRRLGRCPEKEKREPLPVESPSAGSVSSVRQQLNAAMISEAVFIAMCSKEGLETTDQINACRRVIMNLCNRIEKKQNAESEGSDGS